MKYATILLLTAMFCLHNFKAAAQAEAEKLDLPGDNLNLYAALKLFQESATLEGFEKSLNDEKSNINNLDLNGDDKIDYIRVVDNPQGDLHNITLKIAVSQTEDQDVAVFVVDKEADGKVQIQVIGDEDLYGKDYIIEPDFETDNAGAETPNPGYTGDQVAADETPQVVNTTRAEISLWPVVQYIFVPAYNPWRSPWNWSSYPAYWRPWKPFYWHYYYGYQSHWNYFYNSHYRRWHNYRIPGWRDQYYGSQFRSQSVFVRTRFDRGDYRKTYSRPQLARKGADLFRRDYPAAPTVHNKLPSFDKAGRPIIVRPAVTRPVTKPIDGGIGGKPAIERPITTKPVTRPVTRPIETKPGSRPVITRPVTRPIENDPVVKPVITKPVERPNVTRPVTQPVTKPVTRPITQPVTRPVQTPVTRPVTQPVNRPGQRPVTRPTNPPINRAPATRPAASTPRTIKQ